MQATFQQIDRAVVRAAFDALDAEMMALYKRTHRLYLLPPPALRHSSCPAGNICAEETFHTLAGFPISIFVPEAGCPIHDPDD